MWRKNRSKSKTILNIISNCKGIDLNRNFGYNWGEVDVLRSQAGTPLPCLETFIGDTAFSEVSLFFSFLLGVPSILKKLKFRCLSIWTPPLPKVSKKCTLSRALIFTAHINFCSFCYSKKIFW